MFVVTVGQVFDYAFHDGTESFRLLIDTLIEDPDYLALELQGIICAEELARYIFDTKTIEPDKLKNLQNYIIKQTKEDKEAKVSPIIVIDFENGFQAIADGNHRYVLATMIGCYDVAGRVVPRSVWEKHCINHVKKAPNEHERNATDMDGRSSKPIEEIVGR